MATTIRTTPRREARTPIPAFLAECLPLRLREELRRYASMESPMEELRLRCRRRASFTVGQKNVWLDTVLTREEMDGTLYAFCDGSLYAHRDTLAKGYLTLAGGIRVGVCGRAAAEGNDLLGIYDIDGLNIRLPAPFGGMGEPVCRLLRRQEAGSGVLIYAPPGVGKTTLLRCVAERLASGREPWRVVVVDTRGELGCFLTASELCLDVLTGYPRERGMEIAVRTMNAQVIVCDEIGDREEVRAILSAQNCGVPLVASAHAESVAGLLRRDGIRELHQARVFGAYVGIGRSARGGEFDYTITDWETANGRY